MKSANKVVFRKHANIGAADAIEDRVFLNQSFIDTGELEILSDTCDPRAVVVGRTGAGKTALLKTLAERQEHVIEVSADSLSLNYLADNTMLRFISEAGVNLDLFYRLLWRHILIVELIQTHYGLTNETKRNDLLDSILALVRNNRPKQEAVQYLQEWGKSFWKETDYRIKEITNTLETELKNAISGKAGLPVLTDLGVELNREKTKTLTEEQKFEIVQVGQPVVNKVQIDKLSKVIKLLEEDVFNDRKKRYYLTIDKLDENWVNDDLRYQLIRALLETLRDINNGITSVKIIIALREDLLDRVFRYTRGPGYQEEKYKSLFLEISWKENQLEDLLSKRVNYLMRQQYTTQDVPLKAILPKSIHLAGQKIDPTRYILQRTRLRPRDAILFFNECLKAAEGNTSITQEQIWQAEDDYSLERLRSLADEWSSDYKNLIELAMVFRSFPREFPISFILGTKLDDDLETFLTKYQSRKDKICQLIEDNLYDPAKRAFLITEIVDILYKVGVFGVKTQKSTKVSWVQQGTIRGEIDSTSTTIHIHPIFWRALKVSPDDQ